MKNEKAVRIDEFVFDKVEEEWGYVKSEEVTFEVYKKHPEIAYYNGKKYYRMCFNSDNGEIIYREAGERPYHLRFSN